MARPRALDESKRQMVVALIASGMQERRVAECIGCSALTIRRERRVNEDFDQQFRRAKMSVALRPLETMRKASQTHWRAAAWLIDREERKPLGQQTKPAVVGRREVDTLLRDLREMIGREADGLMLSIRLDANIEQTVRRWADDPTGKRPAEAGNAMSLFGPSAAEIRQSMALSTERREARAAIRDGELNGDLDREMLGEPTATSTTGKLAGMLCAAIKAQAAAKQQTENGPNPLPSRAGGVTRG